MKKVSGSNANNSKYDGFIYYVYKSATVRINVLTNDGLSSGYGGAYVANFQLPTAYAKANNEYTIDITYTPSSTAANRSITAVMTPGNNSSGTETITKASSDFPETLAGATIFIGGDDATFGTNYSMNPIEILEFSVSQAT